MYENSRLPSRSRWGAVARHAALSLVILGVLVGRGGVASAETIGFNEAVAGPFTTYSESGFTVIATPERWAAVTTFGNPLPSIQFLRETGEPIVAGTIEITNSSSLFTFSSIDLYSSVTPIEFLITGFLSSTRVFTGSGTLPNPMGTFRTLTIPPGAALEPLDSLVITLFNPIVPVSNPMGLDNIVVTPVPEPGTVALTAWGLATLIAIRKRVKQASWADSSVCRVSVSFHRARQTSLSTDPELPHREGCL